MKKSLMRYIIVAVLILTACCAALIPLMAKANSGKSLLTVKVLTLRGEVIPDAVITIEGYDVMQKTALNGETDKIEIGFNNAKEYTSLKLFVFKSGYVDTVIYNCIVYKDKNRILVVHLLVDDGTLPFLALTEVPDKGTVEDEIKVQRDFISKNKP